MVSQKFLVLALAAVAGVAEAKKKCKTKTPSSASSTPSIAPTPADNLSTASESSTRSTPLFISISTPETSPSSAAASDSTPSPESATSTPSVSSEPATSVSSSDVSSTPSILSATSTSDLSVSVVATTSAPPTPSDCNVVDDPGFENKGSGQASSWGTRGGRFLPGIGSTGYTFQAFFDPFNSRAELIQTLSGVKANSLYRVNFIYAVGELAGSCTINLQVGTNNVGPIVTLAKSSEFKNGGSDFLAPSDDPVFLLKFVCASSTPVLWAQIDNVSIVDTARSGCGTGNTVPAITSE